MEKVLDSGSAALPSASGARTVAVVTTSEPDNGSRSAFTDAQWYDQSINWGARLGREVPVLIDVLGPPGAGGLLDAGCGTGRQACALASRGYRVVGADAEEAMLAIARTAARQVPAGVEFVQTLYANLPQRVAGGFDGVYCLGNALAAAGTREATAEAFTSFGSCLRPGGKLFIQILNFMPMRLETPCVRGPRISSVDGREYVSVRQFHFVGEAVQVTNITLWQHDGWKQRAHCGVLYPVTLEELHGWCADAQLRIDAVWGSYARETFDPQRSVDLLVVATRV